MHTEAIEAESGEQPSLARVICRLARGASWNFVAVSFTQGITFAINLLLARVLGREAFGQYAVVQGSLVTATGLLQTSMGGTSAKYVAEFRDRNPQRAAAILQLCRRFTQAASWLGAIALALAASWLANHVYRMPNLAFGFYVGTAFLFFSTLNSFQMGTLWGLENYRILSTASATGGLASLAIAAVGVWKFGLPGAFVALSAGALIRWAVHALSLRTVLKEHGIHCDGTPLQSALPVVLGFALPSTLCAYVSLPSGWITQALLARQPNGFSDVGGYTAATNIRLLVLFLPQVLNTVGASLLNNHRHHEPATYKLVHRSNMIAMAATNIAVASTAALAYRPLLSLFGKAFTGDPATLWILLASTIPESISIGLHQHVQTQERMWQVLVSVNIPKEITTLLIAFTLIPSRGPSGLAVAYLVGAVVTLISYTLLVWRTDQAFCKVK